jgi:hypothetical protein
MLRNLLALLAGVILLALGLMFSVVILAVAAVLGVVAWIYFWWRTRALRRTLATMSTNGGMDGGGAVIEGEAVRVNDDPAARKDRLPGTDGQG